MKACHGGARFTSRPSPAPAKPLVPAPGGRSWRHPPAPACHQRRRDRHGAILGVDSNYFGDALSRVSLTYSVEDSAWHAARMLARSS